MTKHQLFDRHYLWKIFCLFLFGLGVLLFVTYALFPMVLYIRANNTPRSQKSVLGTIDCGNPESQLQHNESTAAFMSDMEVIARTSNCRKYFDLIDTVAFANVSREEMAFPLAFAHTTHKEAGLLEQTLALLFWPSNSHCIFLDAKTSFHTRKAVEGIVGCYKERFPSSNIFIARETFPIVWGDISVLNADLACFGELLEKDKTWKFVMNPAGSELPLQTVGEISRSLRGVRGNGVIVSNPTPKYLQYRHQKVYELKRTGPGKYDLVHKVKKGHKQKLPPFKLEVMKGSKNVALARNFTEFLLQDTISINYHKWLNSTRNPDEHFYSTMVTVQKLPLDGVTKRNAPLNLIPQGNKTRDNNQRNLANGHFTKRKVPTNKNIVKQSLNWAHATHEHIVTQIVQDSEYLTQGRCVRFSMWYVGKKCKGKNIRGICNFGLGDLPAVWEQTPSCYFANKFNLKVDPVAIMCHVKHMWGRIHNEQALDQLG